jgi:hypothetical protein
MQNLSTEICQLGRFIEADDFNPMSVWTKTRIGGHHAIHIRPDFDLLRPQPGTNDRCREI